MPVLETPVMVLSKCSLVTAHYLSLNELIDGYEPGPLMLYILLDEHFKDF